jgi:hypothetical protein
MAETAARHCEGLPEAIQYFKKAAQSADNQPFLDCFTCGSQ